MTSTIEVGTTHCPRCAGPLNFQLDAVDGGGLRYDVSCLPCQQVYFHVSTASTQLPAAAAA
ncbi:hypothetical protein [Mycobacterium sp. NPDC006124]|uniref:hypothetical protein n=1 Tax=Mycobacterium sp. NPDC006124 TaxID=3156729 RepID=UPI0033AC03F9